MLTLREIPQYIYFKIDPRTAVILMSIITIAYDLMINGHILSPVKLVLVQILHKPPA